MFHGWIDSALYMEKLDSDTPDILRVKVEREFRNVAPQGPLELQWRLGEPGELDMKASAIHWNYGGVVESLIEQLLSGCDDRGLNLKHVAGQVNLENREVAHIARAQGYKVKKKKYARGYGYIIFPKDAKYNGGSDD